MQGQGNILSEENITSHQQAANSIDDSIVQDDTRHLGVISLHL